MNKNPAFLVTLVMACLLAIGLAVVTILYVLSRRQIAQAQSALRLKEEELIRLKEDEQIAITEQVKRQLAAKIQATEQQIQRLKDESRAVDERAVAFDQAIQKVKSWDDLRIVK